ncbi:MAG: VCBS repeat-containing protein [Chloroflexota bacterium]|nr:VCBS repeat-containing protein [Chloroflexota bacterium]
MAQNRIQQRKTSPSRTQATRVTTQDTYVDNENEEYEDKEVWPGRLPSSTRRYIDVADIKTEVGRAPADVQSPPRQRSYRTDTGTVRGRSAIPPRSTATQEIPVVSSHFQPQALQRHPEPRREIAQHTRASAQLVAVQEKRRLHWLVFVGLALFTMMLGWVLLTMLTNWWQVTQDDWHYGRPRTYQTDKAVGHADSQSNPSHFMALNVNRRVEIIEFQGGDPSKAKIYVGPTLLGTGQDLAAVTLTFTDVNGDGKIDMIVNVQDSHFVYINENGTFRPAHTGDTIHLP